MNELALLQREAFAALRGAGVPPCFLRVSLTDDALWVCDLPRKTADTAPGEEALRKLGVLCRLDEAARLWRLDAAEQRYRAWNASLPAEPPKLPADDGLHEAYALCRLLLYHPAPLERQPKDWIRGMLKRSHASPAELAPWIAAAHAACAALLRRGEPLPSMAGGLLANWLTQREAEGRGPAERRES